MVPFDVALTFFAASLALALVPGPDNIFVLTQSALSGRVAGLLVTLGLCTGLVGHTLAVTLGVAAVFQASTLAFTALKLLGAAYLVYLAWQAFNASVNRVDNAEGESLSGWQLYRRGILMNITNPKVSLFFLAFLPQFADPVRGVLSVQLLVLGGLFIVATLGVFGAVAMLAGWLGQWLNRSPREQQLMKRVGAVVFVALAAKLAVS